MKNLPGTVTNSILFCWLFTIKRAVWKSVRFFTQSRFASAVFWRCPWTSAPGATHPTVSIILSSSGSRAQGKLRVVEGPWNRAVRQYHYRARYQCRKFLWYWGVIDIAIFFSLVIVIDIGKRIFPIIVIGIDIARSNQQVSILILVLQSKMRKLSFWYWYCRLC